MSEKTFLVPVPYSAYSVFRMEAESIEEARRIVRETSPDDILDVLEFYRGGDGDDHFDQIDTELIEPA